MRKSLLPLLAAMFLTAVPSVVLASDQRADELIAKHLAALGGRQAVASIKSVVTTADIELTGTGLKGTVESRVLRPCLSFSDISLGLFKIKEGYDGERLWMVDQNGKLQFRHDAASLEYQRTECLLESQAYLFGGTGYELTLLGRDTIGSTPCDRIRMDVDGGTSALVSLNDSTYLIQRIELKAPEGVTIETYGDYRPVGGVMFPFFERTEIPALGQRIEMRSRSITTNETIDPVVFLPPAADVKDWRFTRGHGTTKIPFQYKYNHIFIPARIAGYDRDLLFLLDSGASMTVVDSSIAAAMHLANGGTMPGAGAGGMANFSLTRIPGLTIGDIEFSEQTAISFPISGLLRTFEETEIGGVLGYDFLSRFVTRIDYEHGVLSFFEPDSFPRPVGATVVEAPLLHNLFSLRAALDGVKSSFFLDTGANSSLLHGAFADSTELAKGRRTLAMAIRGAGGEETASLCRFDSLVVGGVTIMRPVLAITRGKKGISVLENVDGVIGNDILERFTVTLDYRAQRVLLERNSRFGEPFFKDRSGLQIARKENGRFIIVRVISDSPAGGAGFQAGDIIVTVARTKAERFKDIRELLTLFEAKEGTMYPIEILRNGRRVKLSLRLADYI